MGEPLDTAANGNPGECGQAVLIIPLNNRSIENLARAPLL